MEGADPRSFEFLDFVYTRDKNAVYSGGKRLTTRVKEFRVLPYPPRYATDGERYFYGDIILPETELEFYGPVKGSAYDYARSKTRVYDRGREIVGADADTFTMELVGIGITKDKNNVYYQNRPIPNADPASFVVVRIGLFEDKRPFYECPHDRCSERPK